MSANALEVISSGAEVTQEELASITAGHAYVVMGPAALHGLPAESSDDNVSAAHCGAGAAHAA